MSLYISIFGQPSLGFGSAYHTFRFHLLEREHQPTFKPPPHYPGVTGRDGNLAREDPPAVQPCRCVYGAKTGEGGLHVGCAVHRGTHQDR